jgi:CRP-like cAMP-binding protein
MPKSTLVVFLENRFLQNEPTVYSKGGLIFKAGSHSDGVFILRKGIIKYTAYKNRKKISLGYFGKDSVHGQGSLLNLASPFSIEALTPVQLEFYPRRTIEADPIIYKELNAVGSDNINEGIEIGVDKLMTLFTSNSTQLIALFLIRIAALNGQNFVADMTRKEISEYANCSVEYVFRTLSKLQKKKIVNLLSRRIEILNSKALADVKNGKAGTL